MMRWTLSGIELAQTSTPPFVDHPIRYYLLIGLLVAGMVFVLLPLLLGVIAGLSDR